jgi:hypothetical protein
VDGDDKYIFGQISGLAADATGRILVSDYRLIRLQVYDSAGRYVRTVGRLGQGPGELQAPMSLAALSNGIVAIVDVGFDAYLWFDARWSSMARRRRPRQQRFAREAIRADGAGSFLDSRRGYDRTYSDFTIVRVSLDGQGSMSLDSLLITAIPETLVRLEDPSVGFRGGAFRIPFAPYTVWTPIRGGVAFSSDGSYLIQRSFFDGRADTLIHRENQRGNPIPKPVAQRVLARPEDQLRALGLRNGLDAERWIEQIELPERFPPVLGLYSDTNGRIWVLGADRMARPTLDVWSQDGNLVGTVTLLTEAWPDLENLAIGPTHILGVFEDELGVQVVRGFAIPETLRQQGS